MNITMEDKPSDFHVGSWISESQATVGLVMLVLTPCGVCLAGCFKQCICCDFPLLAAVRDERFYRSQEKRDEILQQAVDSNQREQEKLYPMWESACLYLLIYAAQKHSPLFTVILGAVYIVLRSVLLLYRGKANTTEETLAPVSVYTDLRTGTTFEYLGVFGIQVTLYMMLMLSVVDQPALTGNEDEKVSFFIIGSFIGTVMRSQQGAFFSIEWRPFWKRYFTEGFRDTVWHYPLRRIFLSWLVNELFAQTTLLMLPLILIGSSDRVEFVKDATAVLFIAELDKLESVTVKQEILKRDSQRLMVEREGEIDSQRLDESEKPDFVDVESPQRKVNDTE